MNIFQKYCLLFYIIFLILLHFIVIKKISFEIFQSNIQEDFDNIQVTLVNPLTSREQANVSNKEKVLSKDSLAVADTKIDIKNKIIVNNQEKVFKSINESIDTSKILSQIKDMDFSTKMQNLKKQQRIKSISANTTDYLYKLYFDAWRQKVEQIGAMNYPTAASELGMCGSLRLTVSLNSDGTIKNLFINKSSGHKELDQAALNIVKLGEPYARFPAEMLKNVDIINITRRWKFTEKNNFSQ